MPFTAAHVTAVLPVLRWRRLDPTCLAIGSMAPDFEYFVRGELVGRFGHTFLGIALWGVPVTLALALLFHRVVKWPLLLAAPAVFTRLFGAPWRPRWLACTISAALGDLTHVLWDGATHANGVIVRHVPALTEPYVAPLLGEKALHRLLQHASTAVGMVALIAYVAWRIARSPHREVVAPRAQVRVVFGACIAAGVALLVYRLRTMNVGDPGSLIAGAISGMLAGMITASVAMRARGRSYRAEVARRGARRDTPTAT